MNDDAPHIPGLPNTPDPPNRLLEALDTLHHPAVLQSGLTTTADGDWALMLTVKAGTPTPLEDVGADLGDLPVVYQEEPDDLPVARPAYPAWGE